MIGLHIIEKPRLVNITHKLPASITHKTVSRANSSCNMLMRFLSSVLFALLSALSSDVYAEELTLQPLQHRDEMAAPLNFGIRVSGRTVYLNASEDVNSNRTSVSYEWHFGDGTRSEGIECAHTYAYEGIYRITLVVKDTAEVTSTTHATVAVSEPRYKLAYAATHVPEKFFQQAF